MRGCLHSRTPWGIHLIRCFRSCFPGPWLWDSSLHINLYRAFVLLLTFIAYICFHMSRKPITVVKTEILNCTGTELLGKKFMNSNSWAIYLSFILENKYLLSYLINFFHRVNKEWYFIKLHFVDKWIKWEE